MENSNDQIRNYNFEKIVDLIIKLGVMYLLFSWCLDILKPFVLMFIWAVVITIAVYPAYSFLVKLFKGKKVIATIVLTAIMLSILLIPTVLITESLFQGINFIREKNNETQQLIPPPSASTKNWPAIAQPLVNMWQMASENLQGLVLKYQDQIKVVLQWLLAALSGIGKGVLQFLAAIIIAGVLLVYTDALSATSIKLFRKLAGNNGENFALITVATVRNVVKGILGVAIIQASMAGIGFFIAGVPFAGLWTIASLILAIIQVGVGPIAIPITIYMFSVSDTVTATILAIWIGFTLISDNILKPILLGRGAPAPMLVIFFGAIGGFIYNGFLGLFLGAVVLTIAYKLLITWLNSENENLIQ